MTLLSDTEIEQRLASLGGWRAQASQGAREGRGQDAREGQGQGEREGHDRDQDQDHDQGENNSIVRELSFTDFPAAIAFVNQVAGLAERANHHPDILVHGWNKVRLTLSTHSAGGLTEADFALAGEIDRLV
jgi:4a-hydroxytetrahydrobiopterin dehydratase